MQIIRFILFITVAHLLPTPSFGQLVINEVSQGPSASQEYVELLVLPNSTCPTSCVDLRGWIIDDNNGTFATGTGQGIAQGVMRLKDDPFWECITPGTLILIYNENDVNVDIPSSPANACVIILPGNSPYLDRNAATPIVNGSSSYVGLTWGDSPNWTSISMSNSDDSFQTIDPNNLSQPYHAVSWGGNSSNNIIKFSGSASGDVFYMANAVDDDPDLQSNWTQGAASTEQTPGLPNNAANAAWINSINNSCMPVSSFADAGLDVEHCPEDDPTTILTASGGVSYEWNTGGMSASITVSPTVTTTYTVTVTDASSCTGTDMVQVIILPSPTSPNITDNSSACDDTATLEASAGYSSYEWSNGDVSASTAVSSTGTYTVTVTDTNSCEATNSINVSSIGANIQFLR